MNNAIRQYFHALDDIRGIRFRLLAKADAFRALHFNDLAEDLEVMVTDLDETVDRLMKNSEAESAQAWADVRKRTSDILSIMLEKSIEEDEARAKQ